MDELVSIIIPAYNSEKLIERCLLSCANQTYKNIEIIVIDDGSNDNTSLIIDDIDFKFDNFKIFHNTNHGASYSRNLGISKAEGEYVMFVDSDDYIAKDMIEVMVKKAKEYNADIVSCNLQNESESSYKLEIPLDDEIKLFNKDELDLVRSIMLTKRNINKGMTILNFTAPYCKLIKKNVIKGCFFPEDIDLGEDNCFCLQIVDKANNFLYLKDVMYHRYIVSSSLSHKYDLNYASRRLNYTKWVLDYIDDPSLNDALNIFVYQNYKAIIMKYFGEYRKLSFSNKKKYVKEFLSSINFKCKFSKIKNEPFLIKHKLYLLINLKYRLRNLIKNK